MKVQRDGRSYTVEVTADGEGLVSHAGTALLGQVADRCGLTRALSDALAPMRERRSGHDPGRVARDLALMLADGGEALTDLGASREQAALLGAVASDSTAYRAIERIARDPELLEGMRSARKAARERAWEIGIAPERVTIDLDATLLNSHSEKEGSTPPAPSTSCSTGRGRAASASRSASTSPSRCARRSSPCLRTPGDLDQDGSARENGEVAEATDLIDLSGWPEGSRLIVRRERPHPGAQLSFTDSGGHRFQAILTDRGDSDIAAIERDHRARARAEDKIADDKDTGLAKLPFRDFAMNQVWLELVLIAHDLLAWTKALLLTGELARSRPKRLRHRLLHLAARLAFSGRRAKLRLQAGWPWAAELVAAFAKLRELPAPPG